VGRAGVAPERVVSEDASEEARHGGLGVEMLELGMLYARGVVSLSRSC
jgi:hypothetical protein